MSHYFELPNAMQGAAEPDFASNNHTKHLVLDNANFTLFILSLKSNEWGRNQQDQKLLACYVVCPIAII